MIEFGENVEDVCECKDGARWSRRIKQPFTTMVHYNNTRDEPAFGRGPIRRKPQNFKSSRPKWSASLGEYAGGVLCLQRW